MKRALVLRTLQPESGDRPARYLTTLLAGDTDVKGLLDTQAVKTEGLLVYELHDEDHQVFSQDEESVAFLSLVVRRPFLKEMLAYSTGNAEGVAAHWGGSDETSPECLRWGRASEPSRVVYQAHPPERIISQGPGAAVDDVIRHLVGGVSVARTVFPVQDLLESRAESPETGSQTGTTDDMDALHAAIKAKVQASRSDVSQVVIEESDEEGEPDPPRTPRGSDGKITQDGLEMLHRRLKSEVRTKVWKKIVDDLYTNRKVHYRVLARRHGLAMNHALEVLTDMESAGYLYNEDEDWELY